MRYIGCQVDLGRYLIRYSNKTLALNIKTHIDIYQLSHHSRKVTTLKKLSLYQEWGMPDISQTYMNVPTIWRSLLKPWTLYGVKHTYSQNKAILCWKVETLTVKLTNNLRPEGGKTGNSWWALPSWQQSKATKGSEQVYIKQHNLNYIS